MSRPVYNDQTEELVPVRGEVRGSMETGISHENRLDSGKIQVDVRYTGFYGDKVATVDVYPSNPMYVVLYCPRCTKPLTIKSEHKQMIFDPAKLELSVARFTCTWELGDDAFVKGKGGFGVNLCKFTAGIERNQMRDA